MIMYCVYIGREYNVIHRIDCRRARLNNAKMVVNWLFNDVEIGDWHGPFDTLYKADEFATKESKYYSPEKCKVCKP